MFIREMISLTVTPLSPSQSPTHVIGDCVVVALGVGVALGCELVGVGDAVLVEVGVDVPV